VIQKTGVLEMKILKANGAGRKMSYPNKMSPKNNKVMEQGTTSYSDL
jgi:hypothetical protein